MEWILYSNEVSGLQVWSPQVEGNSERWRIWKFYWAPKGLVMKGSSPWENHWSSTSFTAAVELDSGHRAPVTPTGYSVYGLFVCAYNHVSFCRFVHWFCALMNVSRCLEHKNLSLFHDNITSRTMCSTCLCVHVHISVLKCVFTTVCFVFDVLIAYSKVFQFLSYTCCIQAATGPSVKSIQVIILPVLTEPLVKNPLMSLICVKYYSIW